MIQKKTCLVCGRKLWLREFYVTASGYILPRCKECERERSRVYRECKKNGQRPPHRRVSVWDGDKIVCLRKWFATTTNNELADILGVSTASLSRKAKALGLSKDPDWLSKLRADSRRMAVYVKRKKLKTRKVNYGSDKL